MTSPPSRCAVTRLTLANRPNIAAAQTIEAHIAWNYTTWLNVVLLGLAAPLGWRFLKTGGPEMLRMMNQPAQAEAHQHSLDSDYRIGRLVTRYAPLGRFSPIPDT